VPTKKGGDEALILYVTVTGKLKNDSDNLLIKQAKSLVENDLPPIFHSNRSIRI